LRGVLEDDGAGWCFAKGRAEDIGDICPARLRPLGGVNREMMVEAICLLGSVIDVDEVGIRG